MAEDEDKTKSGDDGDALKTIEIKPSPSLLKKKLSTKPAVNSKNSLKKGTDSAISTFSDSSSISLGMKRHSEFEKMSKGPRYQNTYRLDSKRPFKSHEVYKILETVVNREVEDYPLYDPSSATKIIQTIAAEVRSSVKLMNYDRYKICVFVYLGEKKLQGFQAAFRALWDMERDGWTTYFHQCRTYFVSCTCYGIYHD